MSSAAQGSAPMLAARLAILAIIAIALGALAYRIEAQSNPYWTVDEEIALRVVARVQREATLDTNWARAGLPAVFAGGQYNFSSYYLFAAGATRPGLDPSDPAYAPKLLERLRYLGALLWAALIAAAALLALRLCGSAAALTVATLTATNVTLFQDSLYARPDTFFALGTVLLALVVTSVRSGSKWVVPVSGLIAGLLLATKVSIAVLLAFALVALAAGLPRALRATAGVRFVGAAALGFAIGAPYAVLAPGEYLNGVMLLLTQYSGGQPPYGVADGSHWDRLQHALGYLSETAGPTVLVSALIGLVLAWRSWPLERAVFVLGVLASAAYFLVSPTFFERNLSHALPFVFLLCGVLVAWVASRFTRPAASHGAAAVLLGALTLPALSATRKLAEEVLPGQMLAEYHALRAREEAQGVPLIEFRDKHEVAGRVGDVLCGQWSAVVFDYLDPHTGAEIAALTSADRFTEHGRIASPYRGHVVSTLGIYHAPEHVLLRPRERSDCPLRIDPLPDSPGRRASASTELRGTAMARAAPMLPKLLEGLPAVVLSTWAGDAASEGAIEVEGEACEPTTIPFLRSATAQDSELVIASSGPDGEFRFTLRPIPRAGERWLALTVSPSARPCRRYRVAVRDPSAATTTWVAFGEPVVLDGAAAPAKASPPDAANDAARATSADPARGGFQ